MSVHVMIDNETMGLGSTAAIIQIGAVAFDLDRGVLPVSMFERTISLSSAVGVGCTTDKATIDWWKTQPIHIQTAVNENPHPVSSAMEEFCVWFRSLGCVVGIWSHGASFDIPQIEFTLRCIGLPCPWSYKKIRDTRTLYWLSNFQSKRESQHMALVDALCQAEDVMLAYKSLFSN